MQKHLTELESNVSSSGYTKVVVTNVQVAFQFD